MSDQSKHRSFLDVSVDGEVTTADDYSCGAIMTQRHGGVDMLCRYRADEVLQACTPLPPRILLAYAVQTRKDRRMTGRAGAVVHAVVALLPATLVVIFLRGIGASREFAGYAFLAIVLGVMLQTYWNESRAPESAWRLVKWLDFKARTWHSR